jgi:DNA methylase/Beta-lactamase
MMTPSTDLRRPNCIVFPATRLSLVIAASIILLAIPCPAKAQAEMSDRGCGIQQRNLESTFGRVKADEHRDLKGIVILCNGRRISEAYFNGDNAGTLHDIRSATKSFTATLMGIAIQQGFVHSVYDSIALYLPGLPRDGKQSITIRDLLTMRSGRVLKQDRLAVMFYGWTKVDAFFEAWKGAGFQPVGHIVFRKAYSSRSRFLCYQHEQAFLLAKGGPPLPKHPLGDVMDMPYSGNKLHPTQKPVATLARLIRSFSLPGEIVLDAFAGAGSTCAAAALTGRRYIGIELDDVYYAQASERMTRVQQRIAAKRRSSPVRLPTQV